VFLSLATLAQDKVFRKTEITEEFRNTFSRKAENIHSLQAYFKQEKYISYLAANVISEGNFYFQKPNSIRWEYTNPYQYIIIIKNGALHIEDGKGKMNFKEQENEIFDHLNILVQNSLSGNVFSENLYETSLMENDTDYRLTVVPTQEKIIELIAKVEIIFDKQNLNVESLTIHETSSDITTISFSNRQYNKSLDKKLFE
jgi:outer membrane lipoprotein-sorting protein